MTGMIKMSRRQPITNLIWYGGCLCNQQNNSKVEGTYHVHDGVVDTVGCIVVT